MGSVAAAIHIHTNAFTDIYTYKLQTSIHIQLANGTVSPAFHPMRVCVHECVRPNAYIRFFDVKNEPAKTDTNTEIKYIRNTHIANTYRS